MGDQNTSTGWRQMNLWCDDWQAAEHMAVTHLGPLLTQAANTGSITCWWFVRKGESWRLRFLLADGRDATTFAEHLTTTLMERGAIRRHVEVIYEPEILAFGGAGTIMGPPVLPSWGVARRKPRIRLEALGKWWLAHLGGLEVVIAV